MCVPNRFVGAVTGQEMWVSPAALLGRRELFDDFDWQILGKMLLFSACSARNVLCSGRAIVWWGWGWGTRH
jgi:hypothetical protein